MFYKSKYDVIESLNVKSSMNLLFVAGKITKDLKQYENKKISKEEFNSRFKDGLLKGIPSVKAIAHIGYENSKDIAKVNQKVLYSYMRKEGLAPEEFRANYNNMINTYVKIILAFGIIEKERLELASIVTPEALMELVKGNFSLIRDAINKLGTKVSDESKVLMDKLVDANSTIETLSSKEKEFLNREHDKYMRENVLPHIKKESTEQEVLKFSKRLGKKKSVLDL